MSPALRIGLLVVFATLLPIAALPEQAAIGATLVAAHVLAGRVPALRRLGRALWRMRWLLAALAMLYVGFTEGTPLWDALPGLSREGMLEGGRRALVLANLVAAVQLLMLTTSVAALIEGLATLLRPLRFAGFDADRWALRIGLVMEELDRLQRMPRTGNALDVVAALSRDIEVRARGSGSAR